MGTTRTLSSRSTAALLALLALVASLLLVVAQADRADARVLGKVRGEIIGTSASGTPSGDPTVKLLWFTKDWRYLGAQKAYGGAYSISLPPGTYRLQFVDQRPAYDTQKYAPTDVTVTVPANRTVVRTVRMRRGAALYGTVRAGGRPAARARVVAASTTEQSYETLTNKRGEWAIGGLPSGSYSVFTYERTRSWIGKSAWVPGLKRGKTRGVPISLSTRAGNLLVDLYAGGRSMNRPVFVTAVSQRSGQFWTARASKGSVTFRGLFPGRYRLVMPGVGSYLGRTGAVHDGRVKPGHTAFGSFALNKRGASVVGMVVDAEMPSFALGNAAVQLLDADGNQLARTTSDGTGFFVLSGPLTTTQDLLVVVAPDPNGGGWMQGGKAYCKFEEAYVFDVSITTGRETDVGLVPLPHEDSTANPALCQPS
jgi:hypothetical protein